MPRIAARAGYSATPRAATSAAGANANWPRRRCNASPTAAAREPDFDPVLLRAMLRQTVALVAAD